MARGQGSQPPRAGLGPGTLGRNVREVFQSGWEGWTLEGEKKPGPGLLIVKMSDDLVVGILRKPGAAPLAMVVDKRVDDGFQTIKPREVELTFSTAVKSLEILEKGAGKPVEGNSVKITLQSGGGQLLRLSGQGL